MFTLNLFPKFNNHIFALKLYGTEFPKFFFSFSLSFFFSLLFKENEMCPGRSNKFKILLTFKFVVEKLLESRRKEKKITCQVLPSYFFGGCIWTIPLKWVRCAVADRISMRSQMWCKTASNTFWWLVRRTEVDSCFSLTVSSIFHLFFSQLRNFPLPMFSSSVSDHYFLKSSAPFFPSPLPPHHKLQMTAFLFHGLSCVLSSSV